MTIQVCVKANCICHVLNRNVCFEAIYLLHPAKILFMFTGIITAIGHIQQINPLGDSSTHGKRLTVETPANYLSDVSLGDSIAINGACMTVTSINGNRFTVDVSVESLEKNTGLTQLSRINLEKALRAHDRLGGHLVSGHVDGLGEVSFFAPIGESWELRLIAPKNMSRYLAYKGSITVNGVSLTVNRIADQAQGCEISINLIPHTVENTVLGDLSSGRLVNLEIDLIARYVERMLSATQKM